MARRNKKGRDISGILLADKPKGLTSNQVLQRVKQLYRANKAGHTGSLDPMATGLLPICLGEATKICSYLLDADKTYTAVARLGVRTDSADAEGCVIQTRTVSEAQIRNLPSVLCRYTGVIKQRPPMHSAIKQNGVPLYKLARKGIEVERKHRDVTIYELTLTEHSEQSFEIRVRCSKGTYIRTLVDDIGESLGCGAHLIALRRWVHGPFDAQAMKSISQLEQFAQQGSDALDTCLLPTDTALRDWPGVNLDAISSSYIQQGRLVEWPDLDRLSWVKLYNQRREFLGIGYVQEDGRVAPKRLMNMANIG